MKQVSAHQQFSLPHNAKGIDHETFAVELRSGKIILTPKDKGDTHYTVNLDGKSGIIDVHETSRDAAGNSRHKTIFALKKSDLGPFIQEISSVALPIYGRLYRRLRLGWLAHRNIGVITVIPTDQELAVLTEKRRKGRLRFKENAAESITQAPEFLEEIWEWPDRVFGLVASKRGIPKLVGFGYKVTDTTGSIHLFWIKKKELVTTMSRIEAQVREIAIRYAIPSAEYAKYQFLNQ